MRIRKFWQQHWRKSLKIKELIKNNGLLKIVFFINFNCKDNWFGFIVFIDDQKSLKTEIN